MGGVLSQQHASVLLAFLESFDLHTSGQWAVIEQAMKSEHGIADPEQELEAARDALQKIA